MNVNKMIRSALATVLMLSPSFGYGASDAGTATATIVAPIAIAANTDLAFGNISATGVAGTVVISTGGVRSVTGGAVAVATGSTESAATFDVTGEGASTYAITLPVGTINITNGVQTMTVGTFTSSPNATGTLTAGAQTIAVGGTLDVGINQAAGAYTGTFTVAVEYN